MDSTRVKPWISIQHEVVGLAEVLCCASDSAVTKLLSAIFGFAGGSLAEKFDQEQERMG